MGRIVAVVAVHPQLLALGLMRQPIMLSFGSLYG